MAGTFIGRDRELAELTAGLQDATDGRGGVFLLSGEPGIGKTELADRVATIARERGAQVAWGRCWEGDGAPPFWPWAQIVRSLAAEHDDEALRAFAGPGPTRPGGAGVSKAKRRPDGNRIEHGYHGEGRWIAAARTGRGFCGRRQRGGGPTCRVWGDCRR